MIEMYERCLIRFDELQELFDTHARRQHARAMLYMQEAAMTTKSKDDIDSLNRLTPEELNEINDRMRRMIEARSEIAC